jgi:hypothetical protein
MKWRQFTSQFRPKWRHFHAIANGTKSGAKSPEPACTIHSNRRLKSNNIFEAKVSLWRTGLSCGDPSIASQAPNFFKIIRRILVIVTNLPGSAIITSRRQSIGSDSNQIVSTGTDVHIPKSEVQRVPNRRIHTTINALHRPGELAAVKKLPCWTAAPRILAFTRFTVFSPYEWHPDT